MGAITGASIRRKANILYMSYQNKKTDGGKTGLVDNIIDQINHLWDHARLLGQATFKYVSYHLQPVAS